MLALALTEPLHLSLTSESERKVQHIRIAFAIIEDQRGPGGGQSTRVCCICVSRSRAQVIFEWSRSRGGSREVTHSSAEQEDGDSQVRTVKPRLSANRQFALSGTATQRVST